MPMVIKNTEVTFTYNASKSKFSYLKSVGLGRRYWLRFLLEPNLKIDLKHLLKNVSKYLYLIKVLIKLSASYSGVPNSSAGPNERAGGKIIGRVLIWS